MGRLEARLSRLEAQTAAPPCPHPWHATPDPITPRRIDYREGAKVLAPGAPPAPAPEPDRCPACGEERPTITVVAVDYSGAPSLGFGHRLSAMVHAEKDEKCD